MTAMGLDRECVRLTEYLIGERPTPYVLAKYRDAHLRTTLLNSPEGQRAFDRRLLEIALKCKHAVRLVDTYAALLARDSMVRRKLTLLLAILETSPNTCNRFDAAREAGKANAWAGLLSQAFGFAVTAVVAVVVLAPLHALAGWNRERDGDVPGD